jgi:hypothetical protein
MVALVDSGATRSMFPMEIAQRLGIEEQLTQDAVGAMGVEGGGFPTWSFLPGLQGQIVRVPPENPQQSEPWGASFAMTPAFAHKDVFLLGRQDFFAVFQIKFEPGNPPHLVIEP